MTSTYCPYIQTHIVPIYKHILSLGRVYSGYGGPRLGRRVGPAEVYGRDRVSLSSTHIVPISSTHIVPISSTHIVPISSTHIVPISSTHIVPISSTRIVPI